MTKGQDLVLVVDDDLAVRESLKFALELEGLEVYACAGGDEMLVHPCLPQAQCIVLDYLMPAMDGFAVLAEIKARNRRTPVIFITGHVTSALRRRAIAAGAHCVIEKSFLDGELVESIRDVLSMQARNVDFRS